MFLRCLLPLLLIATSPASVPGAIPFEARGNSVVVGEGKVTIGGRLIEVVEPAVLTVAPAPVLSVRDEPLKLSADAPAGWSKGTRLRACNARDVNASGSFLPGSLELRQNPGGELLEDKVDYLVDSEWGHVGIGPKSRVTVHDTVYASYRYSLLRLDTVQVGGNGGISLLPGEPHISAPVPPPADADKVAVAHILVDYHSTKLTPEAIYPITETAAEAITETTAGRIPKTLAKLERGEAVTIVCLGDSVTAGGNASKPEFRYVDVFAAGLRQRFPKADITVKNISAGGSNSRQ